MRPLFAVVDTVGRWCAYVSAALMVGIAVLILTEIVSRNLFNLSLSFAWEYASYFMAVGVFLAASYTMRTGGHVRVSLLSQSIPPSLAHLLDILATVIGAVIAVFLAYALVVFAWQSGVTGRTSPTIDETPLVIPQAAIAFGAVMLALQLVVRLIRLVSGEPAEDDAAKQDFGVSE